MKPVRDVAAGAEAEAAVGGSRGVSEAEAQAAVRGRVGTGKAVRDACELLWSYIAGIGGVAGEFPAEEEAENVRALHALAVAVRGRRHPLTECKPGKIGADAVENGP